MVQDAEKFAAEDHKRREIAEARNQADQLIYQVDKFIEENGDKVPEADKTELTRTNDALKEALKDEAAEAATLNQATEATMEVFQRVGQAMYQNQQAAQAAEGAEAGASGDGDAQQTESEDDVVEGEIVEEGGAS
jgi:molecular chaperone DnaK